MFFKNVNIHFPTTDRLLSSGCDVFNFCRLLVFACLLSLVLTMQFIFLGALTAMAVGEFEIYHFVVLVWISYN